jgi:hypothetical protein
VSGLWPRPRLRAVRDLVPGRLSSFVERVPSGPEPVDGLLVTAAEVADTAARHPLAAVEDASRLSDPAVLHHFLTRLFQGARLRSIPPTAGAPLMDGWRAGCGSPDDAVALIGEWSARHRRSWVSAQSLLEPYPAALRDPSRPAGIVLAAGRRPCRACYRTAGASIHS